MTISLSWESLISVRRSPWRQITQSHASGFWLFDAFRKENTALRHCLQPFARTPPDYVSENMQHKVTSCFPFLEHYRLSTSIKISSRPYVNSRFTPEHFTINRRLRPDMRRKKVFSAPNEKLISWDWFLVLLKKIEKQAKSVKIYIEVDAKKPWNRDKSRFPSNLKMP